MSTKIYPLGILFGSIIPLTLFISAAASSDVPAKKIFRAVHLPPTFRRSSIP